MIEMSTERINKILHEETANKEELSTILRGIYTRYMRLYERYFADIDALNDEKVAELRSYSEETKSLIKYYYLDIPLDVSEELQEFDTEYNDKLLGSNWHDFLDDLYKEFRKHNKSRSKTEETLKAEFVKQMFSTFYDVMDYIFRDSFGTNSETAKDAVNGLSELLFGK